MDQPTNTLPQPASGTTMRRVGGGRVDECVDDSEGALAQPVPRSFSRCLAHCLTRAAVNVAVWVAGGIVLLPATTQAQDAGGPIVIAGPAEKNPAALNDLAQRIQTPAQRSASAASLAAATAQSLGRASASRDTDTFGRAASASGAIVIPGAGEPAAAAPAIIRTNFKPDAIGVVTIPPAASTGASGVARVNVEAGPAASVANRRVVVANAPQGDGFDSLAARGEPPEFGANGKPIAAAAAQAAHPGIARTPTTSPGSRQPAAVIAQRAPQTGTAATAAQAAPLPGQQDPEAIHASALAFLQQQAVGLPGKADITVAPAFPRGLAACTSLEPFMPTGARLWGRLTVGVRCAGERPWTIYLQARISLHATYYLAARAMAPGEVLTAADLVAREGDLTGLPQAIVTDPSQAVGSVSLARIAGGMPLRRDMLKSASAVVFGQTVRVIAAGDGFSISSEGSAMNNASPGQQVRVKTANGQIISGIVKDGGTVEIQM
ncbi:MULTISPECIES: flagellar basal body P-ring formation chaperone FlgA [unclassified Paraburkholderia]|uniref:flagellar basal body P-ring formation chaperone FlgA n=1 Tax=unclassified Paraburkholderia TaxID=2615204 RepID=UPI001619DCB6|nr:MULTISPECIES: flagellar basal body P-ring formation chaperone FlgA [unclassified Paraburkholderia]MBB5446045.1 flagella basal body P-ring formation protein FlgA [Paraburkholderia sp. WSM4177]MBB5486524.1 flagella basal body P-ring formation protein FlgA [Paraburkholderia sp. WSM4180]